MSRRLAREKALQVLFQVDVGRTALDLAWREVLEGARLEGESLEYARTLVRGALDHLPQIDRLIEEHSWEWRLERMGNVDRNILRLGVCELLYHPEVPPGAVINEAVELAKIYHGEEAGRFVNGVLDAIHRAHVRRENGERRAQE
ncbi:MAG: transcription antitermination factor NusB [Clostridia bacterium]|nr:transcription antitermination factor NusB [Clostridia bacterium]